MMMFLELQMLESAMLHWEENGSYVKTEKYIRGLEHKQKRRQKANCVTLMETIAKQVLVKANLHRMKTKAKAKNFFDVCRLFLFLAYCFTLSLPLSLGVKCFLNCVLVRVNDLQFLPTARDGNVFRNVRPSTVGLGEGG